MPSKTPPRRAGRHAALAIFLLVIVVAFLVSSALITNILSPVTPTRNAKTVLVSIPSGSNVRTIGALLERRGLVRHALGFVLAARLDHVSGKMRAGRYELTPAMPPRQIAILIALGETANDVVVIPEGFTVAQIAQRLAQHHMAQEQVFLHLARTQGRTFHISGLTLPSDNLEGYLFPDTYRIPKNADERVIITQMLTNFRARVVSAQAVPDLPAVLTLASLVEREAEANADRPLVAAALHNRLQRGMRLQCDASVQYALPEHKARLLFSDLRVNSPYNTYLHAGLPPTPICNPGLASIDAARNPAASDVLFYVAAPGGRHIFSRTLAEHDQAIARLRAAGARE